jgi:hypothetical protein
MRKFVLVLFVAFTASVFALSSVAQRRGRARGRPAAPAAIPNSPHIAEELGAIQWGWTHDQVINYYRDAITARYQPLLRNKGQVEQDRLMQDRDQEIRDLRQSYVQFNGQQNQRRWDTSFVGHEYTHNNGESMLVHDDQQHGNREFFFFFNDHLWKRYQARELPRGGHLEFDAFTAGMEQMFGHGQQVPLDDPPGQTAMAWQDAHTRLHLVNNATFFNVFCLVYEEKATLARLTELRHNMPAKAVVAHNAGAEAGVPQVGNVEGDQNTDIVDRITGHIRHSQDAHGAQGAPTGGTASAGAATAPANTPSQAPANGNNNQQHGDDFGLGGL